MNICIFCGSSPGKNPIYIQDARDLGRLIATKGHGVVYGGANIGLMGAIADAVLEHGGKVTGVIPAFLVDYEIAHRGISELIVVGSMHDRKKRMADHADAFIAMPGGWGTLDELAEMLTWKQLHLISKPIGILNTNGFFDPLLQAMKQMADEGFLKHEQLDMLVVRNRPDALLAALIPEEN